MYDSTELKESTQHKNFKILKFQWQKISKNLLTTPKIIQFFLFYFVSFLLHSIIIREVHRNRNWFYFILNLFIYFAIEPCDYKVLIFIAIFTLIFIIIFMTNFIMISITNLLIMIIIVINTVVTMTVPKIIVTMILLKFLLWLRSLLWLSF